MSIHNNQAYKSHQKLPYLLRHTSLVRHIKNTLQVIERCRQGAGHIRESRLTNRPGTASSHSNIIEGIAEARQLEVSFLLEHTINVDTDLTVTERALCRNMNDGDRVPIIARVCCVIQRWVYEIDTQKNGIFTQTLCIFLKQ